MAEKLKAKTVQEKETNALDDLFKSEYDPHDYEEEMDEFIDSKVDLHDIRKAQQQTVSQSVYVLILKGFEQLDKY